MLFKWISAVILLAAILIGCSQPTGSGGGGGTTPVTGVSLKADGAAIPDGSQVTLWAGAGSEKHTAQLEAVIAPANATKKAVTWTSSAPAIAAVTTAGLVTAAAEGEAVITVTTADGGKEAGVTIKVLPAGTVEKKVESVSIRIKDGAAIGSAHSLSIGDSLELEAVVLPADATNPSVTWVVSNAAVAAISDAGVLTAAAAGTADITVTTVGQKADGTPASASFTLTVTENEVSVPAYIYQWEAGDVTEAFSLSSSITIKEQVGDPAKSWARTNGTIAVSNTGINMPNSGRFSIGSKSTTATTATGYDTNGEFNFTQKAKVTVGYTTFTGSGLQIYVNNNTTSDANSVLTNSAAQLSSKILSGMTGEAASGTITAIIDPANFAQTDEALASLQHAFLGFRCESGGSITITSILIETVPPATDPVTAVTIAPDTDLTLKVGTTASTTLTANITPETDVTYAWTITSGDDMVEFDGVTNKKTAKIKIKSGVTIAGSATVQCVASGPAGSTAQAVKSITVALPVFNSVTVSLPADSSGIIGINGTISLSAAIDETLLASVFTPTYAWTVTSGSSVAAIDSGADAATAVIKGIANGSATVQCAVTINGEIKTDSKNITVSGSIPVTGITISAPSATVMAGDGGSNSPRTLQFSKEVLPINATIQTVTWSVKNGSDYTTAGAATAATINSSGLLTAQSAPLAADTEVWVFAAADDSSGIVSAGYKVTVKPYADQLIWKWDLATNGAPSIPVRNTAGTLNATNIMVTNNTVTGTASGIDIGSGGRICFGTNQSTATTNSNYVAGSFDFRRPIKITVDYSSGVNSKKFRIWVSNNTSGQNSVLGDPCRIYNGLPVTSGGTINAVFDPSTFMASGTDAQKQTLQNAFVCFGVESSGGIVVNSILIEYND
jgi:hypothetical protein